MWRAREVDTPNALCPIDRPSCLPAHSLHRVAQPEMSLSQVLQQYHAKTTAHGLEFRFLYTAA